MGGEPRAPSILEAGDGARPEARETRTWQSVGQEPSPDQQRGSSESLVRTGWWRGHHLMGGIQKERGEKFKTTTHRSPLGGLNCKGNGNGAVAAEKRGCRAKVVDGFFSGGNDSRLVCFWGDPAAWGPVQVAGRAGIRCKRRGAGATEPSPRARPGAGAQTLVGGHVEWQPEPPTQ